MPAKSPAPQTIKKAPLLADNRAARTRDVAVRGRRWRSLFVSLSDHCCAFIIPHEPDVSVGCLKVVKDTLLQSFLARKLPTRQHLVELPWVNLKRAGDDHVSGGVGVTVKVAN
ncbi:hypothetical protein [Rhizobium grahamii]|uniref:hypothetical protein n=1 Tax=Rhizobium grahamii TaxID=1120045 RepID=UPI001146BD86|nr:hypothetical protein [Rhizobium grahamii]